MLYAAPCSSILSKPSEVLIGVKLAVLRVQLDLQTDALIINSKQYGQQQLFEHILMFPKQHLTANFPLTLLDR